MQTFGEEEILQANLKWKQEQKSTDRYGQGCENFVRSLLSIQVLDIMRLQNREVQFQNFGQRQVSIVWFWA